MSKAKPMETAERQALYVKQNGRLALSPRQQRQSGRPHFALSMAVIASQSAVEVASARARDGSGRTPTGCATSIAASYAVCAVKIVEPSSGGTRQGALLDRPGMVLVIGSLSGDRSQNPPNTLKCAVEDPTKHIGVCRGSDHPLRDPIHSGTLSLCARSGHLGNRAFDTGRAELPPCKKVRGHGSA
jgi:hypothetical protein